MKYYSTSGSSHSYSLKEAVLNGLPEDGGLFMPERIPSLQKEFFDNIEHHTFKDIALEISTAFLQEDLPGDVIYKIVSDAITFPVPVKQIESRTHFLELFHGPTLAFKDFGARFMAQLMSYFVKQQNNKLTILVATSGDTGGAVANGFYKTEGIEVIILYPSGKVSALQEKQLTTLGANITALEIKGTFDDCQRLVKAAFPDSGLQKKYQLSSANSINISRLIPQSFYYLEGYRQVHHKKLPVVFSIPSGNFGNLTAGLIAKRMGLPVRRFIAAVNANDVFPNYLNSGKYEPKPSVKTVSNAMDVGTPSNFSRILSLYNNDIAAIKNDIISFSFSDEETIAAIENVYREYGYIMDPHGAVGYLGWKKYGDENSCGVILETAHPAKFSDETSDTHIRVDLPPALSGLSDLKKESTVLSADFTAFKEFLLSR
jgi:threonine synthase